MTLVMAIANNITSDWTWADTWALLAAFASLAAALLTYLQFRRVKHSWQAQNAIVVAHDLQKEEQRDARRRIYQLAASKKEYAEWNSAEKEDVDRVIAQLSVAAYLQARELLPSNMLQENWGYLYRRIYVAGLPRILDRQVKGDAELWVPFVKLSKELLKLSEADNFYLED